MSGKWVGLILAILGGAILIVAPQVSRFVPDPTVESGVVAKSFTIELLGYANIFEDAAKDVAAGKLKTDKDLLDSINPKTGEARRLARSILDNYVQAKLPRDGVNLKPEASEFLKDLGRQFREASP